MTQLRSGRYRLTWAVTLVWKSAFELSRWRGGWCSGGGPDGGWVWRLDHKEDSPMTHLRQLMLDELERRNYSPNTVRVLPISFSTLFPEGLLAVFRRLQPEPLPRLN